MNFSYIQRLHFFTNIAVGFTFLYNFPSNFEWCFGVLQIPNVFRQFCCVSSFRVSKGCLMVSVTFLKVCGQSHVGLSCCIDGYCGLIYDNCLKAFSFEWAIGFNFFLQLQVSGCCVGVFVFERTCLLCDEMMDFIGMHGLLSIRWKIVKKCKPYSNVSKKCHLCLYEKFIIICKSKASLRLRLFCMMHQYKQYMHQYKQKR